MSARRKQKTVRYFTFRLGFEYGDIRQGVRDMEKRFFGNDGFQVDLMLIFPRIFLSLFLGQGEHPFRDFVGWNHFGDWHVSDNGFDEGVHVK